MDIDVVDADDVGVREAREPLRLAVEADPPALAALRALRLVLTGSDRGPELWAVLAALPPEEALRRVESSLAQPLR